MFRNSIATTPFTTDAANSYFTNITGEFYGSDGTFLSSLRALIAPRIPTEESIYLKFGSSAFSKAEVRSAAPVDALRAICRGVDLDQSGLLYVHNFSRIGEDNAENLKIVDEHFTEVFPQFTKLENVTAFFRKTFAVLCFIDKENKTSVIFADALDTRKMHYLQSAILAYLPWYFDKSAGITEAEKNLIYSFREKTPENYEASIAVLAEQYDFRTAQIRQMLSGFESRYERIECEKVERDIQSVDVRLNQLNEQFGQEIRKRNDLNVRLLGLKIKIANGDGDSEIMEYFLCNQRLVLESVTNNDMFFSVKDYLAYFDQEMAERAIDNPNSFVYAYLNTTVEREDAARLLKEIFVSDEPILKIRVCAGYRFSLNGSVNAQGSHNFGTGFITYLPNPHIDRFTCMGNYGREINERLRNNDYIGALEQCIASAKSLNWGDSPVMEEFIKKFFANNAPKCVELPDGSVVKPKEAITWLKSQEKNGNGQEEQEETQAQEG